MDRHLYNQMAEIEQKRLERGIPDTNMQLVRIWLEWAKSPDARLMDKSWFRMNPVRDHDTGERPSCLISRKGLVWPVGYSDHSSFTHAALGIGTDDIAKAGWVHVSGGSGRYYYALTPQQKRAADEMVQAGIFSYDFLSDRSLEASSWGYPQMPRPYEGDRAMAAFNSLPRKDYNWRDDRNWQDRTQRPVNAVETPMYMEQGLWKP